MRIWTEAVTNAIRRHVAATGSPLFTRQALIAAERADGGGDADARPPPTQTMGRELQQLRDAGLLEFLGRGTYRWLGPEVEPTTPSKGVFVLRRPEPGRPARLPPPRRNVAEDGAAPRQPMGRLPAAASGK